VFSFALCLPWYSVFLTKDIMARKNREGEQDQDSHGQGFSRRGFFGRAIGGGVAAIGAINAARAGAVKEGAKMAARGILNGADAYVSSRKTDTSGLDTHIEVEQGDAVVMLGNSAPTSLAKEDGIDLATSITEHARAKGMQLHPYSGAAPGTVAAQVPEQYDGLKDKIPAHAGQHIGIWAGENQGKQVAGLFPALQRASEGDLSLDNIANIAHGRGQAIDGLREDYRTSGNAVLNATGGRARSYRQYGSIPSYRSRQVEQITADGQQVTVPVAGESLPELATRVLLKDWENQINAAAADNARDVKRERGIPAMFQDPAPDVQPSDFAPDSPDHFRARARNGIARRTVGTLRPRSRES
jgi:hypothetical protein